MKPYRKPRFGHLAFWGLGLLAILVLAGSSVAMGVVPSQASAIVQGVAATGPVLSYQGRLVDPLSGLPKPNGNYQMLFGLYNVETGGSRLWSEARTVAVANGLFSVLLGEVSPLNTDLFNERPLWLGVTVGLDPEATPRLPLVYTAYALYARQAGNADTVGGQSSNAFAAANHEHSAASITAGTLATARYSAYDDLTSEGKIGLAPGQVAVGNHIHDDRYYGESEADSRFVNSSGDTMTGPLTVPKVSYSAPHVQYLTIGGEGFVPGSNVNYTNTYGNGGAYIQSGGGALVAPVHLPQGAEVIEFKAFFYDGSPSDMIVTLYLEGMSGGYVQMAEVTSAGVSGYGNRGTINIATGPIDNSRYSYLVDAFCGAWDGDNLRLKGVLITYTLSEAQ